MVKNIFVGTCGWFYEHWQKRFYPLKLLRDDWLSYYSNYFNTTEVNMTFYRTPFPNMVKGWYNKTPNNFLFTLKAPRFITHIKKFRNVRDAVKRFYKLADLLKEKLACILFQAPPSFKYSEDNFRVLRNFLDLLDERYKNVIEFRHENWWRKETNDLLKNKASFCTVSSLEMPSDIVATSDFIYVRFHGLKKECYSQKELKEWANRIKTKAEKEKVKEIYCYFNNDSEGYAIRNAFELQRFLN